MVHEAFFSPESCLNLETENASSNKRGLLLGGPTLCICLAECLPPASSPSCTSFSMWSIRQNLHETFFFRLFPFPSLIIIKASGLASRCGKKKSPAKLMSPKSGQMVASCCPVAFGVLILFNIISLSVAAPAQSLDLAERLLQVGGCLMVSKVSGQESAMDTWFELLLVKGVQARV